MTTSAPPCSSLRGCSWAGTRAHLSLKEPELVLLPPLPLGGETQRQLAREM